MVVREVGQEFNLVGDRAPCRFAVVSCRVVGVEEDVVVYENISNADRFPVYIYTYIYIYIYVFIYVYIYIYM